MLYPENSLVKDSQNLALFRFVLQMCEFLLLVMCLTTMFSDKRWAKSNTFWGLEYFLFLSFYLNAATTLYSSGHFIYGPQSKKMSLQTIFFDIREISMI